ncbi:MAG: hypothetical protein JXD22_07610 [Sedimentisphaerales bacterium]|nr:hypothetical protein [Sedimentisphaerales bacterium]
MATYIFKILLALILLLLEMPVYAQDFEHDRGGAGGLPQTSQGGSFSLNGTLVQEQGTATGGDFSLSGGFLSNSSGVCDLDDDFDVDLQDFSFFSNQWFSSPGFPSADIYPLGGDGVVDMQDLYLFALYWLEGK